MWETQQKKMDIFFVEIPKSWCFFILFYFFPDKRGMLIVSSQKKMTFEKVGGWSCQNVILLWLYPDTSLP